MTVARGARLGAVVWSAGIIAFLVGWPVYGGTSTTVTSVVGGATTHTTTQQRATLLEVNGPTALFPLAIPLVIAGIPLFGRSPQRQRGLSGGAAVAMLAFNIIGGFSIGGFFVPATILLLIGAMPSVDGKTKTAAPGGAAVTGAGSSG